MFEEVLQDSLDRNADFSEVEVDLSAVIQLELIPLQYVALE